MPSAKTIQLFLMDGDPQKRMKATLSNWTGIAFLLPRTMLKESKQRPELHNAGVYLLLGVDEEGTSKVYVGQARKRKNDLGVLGRIMEHRGEERLDYWTHAIALVTSNNTLDATEVSYLENRLSNMAREAGRYEVVNRNEPSQGSPTEEKQAELDEFIGYVRMIIGALGYKVLEPIDATPTPEPAPSEEPLLFMTYGGCDARGRQTSDGFAVLKGSRVRPESDFVRTMPAPARKKRAQYAADIASDNTLGKDILFSSPSAAASFVGGAALNGLISWRDAQGVTLKDKEKSE